MLRFLIVLIALLFTARGQKIQDAPVALIPLDSRPATATLPVDVAAVGGIRVVTPPLELMGDATTPAKLEAIYAWLENANPRALVVSLDALAYGGLVQSRSSELTAAEAWTRLQPLREWQTRLKRPVHAFITIPRHPDATDRARNLEVIRKAFDWAADGTLSRLSVTWDDALPGSPAPGEGERLRAEAWGRNLNDVLVYPGADEVASTLLSSLALEGRERLPRLRLEYSDPAKRTENVVYDGQPLEDSVRMQARAAGVEIVDSGGDATLYIYNGGDMRTAAVRLSVLARRGPVALVDIATVNKASTQLVNDITVLQRYMNLYAFAAWGTPGNNLGTALAQSAMRFTHGPSLEQSRLLLRQYVNDFLYSAIVRPQIRERYGDLPLDTEMARRELLEYLNAQFDAARLSKEMCLEIRGADFPWGRSFEVRLEVDVRPAPSDGCR
jgi:Protein of unknown function (DUF4127)